MAWGSRLLPLPLASRGSGRRGWEWESDEATIGIVDWDECVAMGRSDRPSAVAAGWVLAMPTPLLVWAGFEWASRFMGIEDEWPASAETPGALPPCMAGKLVGVAPPVCMWVAPPLVPVGGLVAASGSRVACIAEWTLAVAGGRTNTPARTMRTRGHGPSTARRGTALGTRERTNFDCSCRASETDHEQPTPGTKEQTSDSAHRRDRMSPSAPTCGLNLISI